MEDRNPHRQVDNDLRSYFNHVKTILDKNEFEDEEERQILLNNVFSELRHKELNIATHSGVTRTLEGFLPLFSPYKLRAFLYHLRDRYVRLSSDCAGCHIFEKVLGLFSNFLGDESADADEQPDEDDDDDGTKEKETIPSCVDTILYVCEELSPEWGTLTTDNYGTHVVRTLLRVLAGLPSEPKPGQDEPQAAEQQQEARTKAVPAVLLKKAQEVVESILGQLDDGTHKPHDIIFHRCACPTVQTMMAVLRELKPERLEQLIAQMLLLDSKDIEATRKHMAKAVRHPIASHFVEKALQLCSPDTYMRLYSDFFRHHIVEYTKDPSANYVVQQLIVSARHHAQPKVIFEELQEHPNHIRSLFQTGKGGLMLKLVEAFTKFSDFTKKDKRSLCTSIRDVFMVEADQEEQQQQQQHDPSANRVFDIRGLLEIKSTTREPVAAAKFTAGGKKKKKKSGKKASPFSPVGCRLAQALMAFPFDCVDFLLNRFLALEKEYLLAMGLDTAASRVVEAYLDDSCAAPVKHKLKVIRAMQGLFGQLAVDRCGSHIVEKCYKTADVAVKALMAEELLIDEKKLDAEKYGKAVLIKCKIGSYKLKKEAWTQKAVSIDKKRKMFEDLLDDQDDDLLPSAKAVALVAGSGEAVTKKKGASSLADDTGKFSSPALKKELRRAAKKYKVKDEDEDGEEESEEKEEEEEEESEEKPQLDAVESQMMELLGYAGDEATGTRKRPREEPSGKKATKKAKKQRKKQQKQTETDSGLGFILDVIAATRTDQRAEAPKKIKQDKKMKKKNAKQSSPDKADGGDLLAEWAGFGQDE